MKITSISSHLTDLSKAPYLKSLIILSLFILLSFGIKFFSKKIVKKLVKKAKTDFDDIIAKKIQNFFTLLILLFGIKQSLSPFKIKNTTTEQLVDTLMLFVFILLIINIFNKMIDLWGIKYAEKTKSTLDTQIPVIKKASNFAIYTFGVIYLLRIWKIEIAPIIASLGIAGIAVGFALKETLENLFAGISVLLDRSFIVGDKIQLESGEVGEIADIGLRSTKLRTYDNEIIYVPNRLLANTKIKNYSQPDEKSRISVKFSVEYGTDISKVENVILNAISNIKDILENPAPEVIFLEMGDFSLSFVARFWVKDYRIAYSKKVEATKLIYNTLNSEGIGIPFPTRTIYFKNSKNEK